MTTVLPKTPEPATRTRMWAAPYRTTTVGLLLVVTLLAFEAMAVGTVMPVAARDLNGLSLYAWAFSAVFILGLVGNVVAGGWADARGPAQPLLIGLAVFTAGLVIVGTAPVMAWFVAGRAVQGLGSGLASVPIYVIVARVYPEAARPKFFAAMSGAWVIPSLVGPSIGGLIAQHLGWRWVFLGLIPLVAISVLMLVPALRGLPSTRGAMPRGRVAAAVALSSGAAIVLWGADHRSPFGVLGLAGLVYGVRHLLPRGTPRLARGLPTAVAMRALMFGALSGTEAFIPLTLTTRYGFSPSAAGVALTAGAIGWSLGSWWQGRFPEASRVPFIVAGALMLALGVAGTGLVLNFTGWAAVSTWILAGAGMGTAYPALSILVLSLSSPEEQGTNSSAIQISDTLGSSLVVGMAGALVNAAGLNAGLTCTAVIAVVGALAAHRVRNNDA